MRAALNGRSLAGVPAWPWRGSRAPSAAHQRLDELAPRGDDSVAHHVAKEKTRNKHHAKGQAVFGIPRTCRLLIHGRSTSRGPHNLLRSRYGDVVDLLTPPPFHR